MTHAIVAKKKDSSGAHGLIYFVLERIKRGYWGVGYVGCGDALSRDMNSVIWV